MWTLLRVFLSTPSARRATADCNVDVVRIAGFLSTPSARRATPPIAAIDHIAEFLSTPSARRATSCPATPSTEQRNFYPRPPRGGRRTAIPDKPVRRDFYPRPPRGGRRGCAHGLPLRKNFYPRPPRGGRLVFQVAGDAETVISIHALCEEGDVDSVITGAVVVDFYPRPLRGGRPGSVRGMAVNLKISIHALCEEGDDLQRGFDNQSVIFLSTPSARRATSERGTAIIPLIFLSTPSARRATCGISSWLPCSTHFYPRPLRGGRPCRPRRMLRR